MHMQRLFGIIRPLAIKLSIVGAQFHQSSHMKKATLDKIKAFQIKLLGQEANLGTHYAAYIDLTEKPFSTSRVQSRSSWRSLSPKLHFSSRFNSLPISSISQSLRFLLGWIFQEHYTLDLIIWSRTEPIWQDARL